MSYYCTISLHQKDSFKTVAAGALFLSTIYSLHWFDEKFENGSFVQR